MQRRLTFALLMLLVVGPAFAPTTGDAQPAGFVDAAITGLGAGSVDQPTAFAFLPNGDLLITTKPGQLLLYTGGALRSTPVFDRVADICEDSERGLLGVAVDPAFSSNRNVYVYYTFDQANSEQGTTCARNNANAPVNRVSKLTLSAGMTTADETVLLDNIPSPNGNHNGGDLQFGKDGYLYVSVGDGGANNDTARTLNELSGNILRITRDGGIPADNPYTGAGSARCYDPAPGGNKSGVVAANLRCREIFSYGLRNPFRIAFDPNVATTRFYINDVGQNSAEEISAGASGADYGWNCYEGTLVHKTNGVCDPLPSSPTPPLFEYQRPTPLGQSPIFDGCDVITGGAFVPDGLWPAAYDGAYLFADMGCANLFGLRTSGATLTPEILIDGRAITHMSFGPFGNSQALYYADYGSGAIRTLRYTGAANRAPVARVAQTGAGAVPLAVALSGVASTDADGTVAAYLWDFGDGVALETSTSTTTHTYAQEGTYTITLSVRDNTGVTSFRAASVSVTVRDSAAGSNVVYFPVVGR